jgi:hypothetical protein
MAVAAKNDRGSGAPRRPSARAKADAGLEDFEEVLRAGVEGNSASMLQLLRRLLRNPPPSLNKPEVLEVLSSVANQAVPPAMPLRARQETGLGGRLPRSVSDTPLAQPGSQSRLQRPQPPLSQDFPSALTIDRTTSATKPLLGDAAAAALEEIVAEHSGDFYETAGVPPTRTVLLTGKPGTGKTMTARWIASALGRELFTIDLGALMSSELGRSAINLQVAMRTAARADAVLFIDELDAIAKARGEGSDVGEARRLVNVFLLELDQWPSGHLLVGATNHPELLDRAVDRRFERRLVLVAPDQATRTRMIATMFPEWRTDDVRLLADLTDGSTGSDLQSIALRARRTAAHKNDGVVSLADAIAGMDHLPKLNKIQRDRVIRVLHQRKMSDRAIASILGVTHPTVAASLRGKP